MQYASGQADDTSSSASAIPCHRFSLADIEAATNNFDDERVIGEGGFGKVYKGSISIEETNHVVAIKRLNSMSNQGAPEFKAEIEILSKLRHCHLVSLMGFCDDNKEMILVYEYMPHGTLHDQLHKAAIPFSWVQRLKIAIGAGRGLDYLHTGFGTQQGIIHRDVKSSNILLDENLAAKLSDFGLSKIGPTNQSLSCIEASVKGTLGYLDPEFFYTTQLTRKTDVYAFGVVLFELLSGRLPVDIKYGEEQCSLVRWAQKYVTEKKFEQMADSKIQGTISPKCLRQFAQIAYRCLISIPKERPTIAEVVGLLQKLLELQKKWEISANQSGAMGFTSKIHKYFVFTTKQSSGMHKLFLNVVCAFFALRLQNNLNIKKQFLTLTIGLFNG
uniref:receptor-like protein kinase FERONIA n=1 Tax=Erigeron canadensis TaxID=72917 RepID=UPI001CB8D2DC|nr:receptor-like protein kinase FERONIA [Erigeron canadensis]